MQANDIDLRSVNRAFSAQSFHFDEDDSENSIIQKLRQQVYDHVTQFLLPKSKILELNAGTGIDAFHFASKGHHVHATDLSDGMISTLQKKIVTHGWEAQVVAQQLSYLELEKATDKNFDYVFSNFGGLNCIPDVSSVARHLETLMKPSGFVTLVIMPPVCLWELAGVLKGNRNAFRRLNRNGVMAHLEGVHFRTWYHSLSAVKKAMGKKFDLVQSEGLAALSPPPYAKDFVSNFPRTYRLLNSLDRKFRKYFPFNRWADHLIITFKYRG